MTAIEMARERTYTSPTVLAAEIRDNWRSCGEETPSLACPFSKKIRNWFLNAFTVYRYYPATISGN